MHVRQPEVTALKAIGQLRVIEPEQVQDGGMQVVDMNLILAGVKAKIVRFAEGQHSLQFVACSAASFHRFDAWSPVGSDKIICACSQFMVQPRISSLVGDLSVLFR